MNFKKFWYVIPIVIGVVLFLDQFRLHGTWYEPHDIDNHETIALSFLFFGFGALVSELVRR